jgi:MAF protein
MLLSQLDLDYEVYPADIDESRRPEEPPAGYVERLAREKAGAVGSPDAVIVAADTAVVHEGRVMGKPAHPQEARSMLGRLQGNAHEVFTGVAVAHDGSIASMVDITEVTILPMTDEEIREYVDTGEPTAERSPTRMTDAPNSRTAATAPSTTTAGPWSPPMASTAIFMRSPARLERSHPSGTPRG